MDAYREILSYEHFLEWVLINDMNKEIYNLRTQKTNKFVVKYLESISLQEKHGWFLWSGMDRFDIELLESDFDIKRTRPKWVVEFLEVLECGEKYGVRFFSDSLDGWKFLLILEVVEHFSNENKFIAIEKYY
jgi:hypothetical protein